MEKIGLVTDDICSLPQKLINKFQIGVVRTKLYFPELKKFPGKNIYQVMEKTKAYPRTSAPSPGDFLKIYKKMLKNFKKILVITLSSNLSATYNSAFGAKEIMPDPSRIILFDSRQASAIEGLLVLRGAELAKEGKKIEEIIKILEKLREKGKFFAFLRTTYWVEKIGRISYWQATAFKILKGLGIQPLVGIKKGKVGLVGFNFRTKDILKAIFRQIKHFKKKYRKIRLGINYTDNINLAYKLKEKIEKELKSEVVFISLVPVIVGANSGPGTLIAGAIPVQ